MIAAINKRTKAGKGFTILAVAEGAISKEDAVLSKKEYKEKVAKRKYPSVSYEIADQIFKETGVEVRVTVRDIHKGVEVHALMTVYSAPDLVPQQHRLLWMRITAI